MNRLLGRRLDPLQVVDDSIERKPKHLFVWRIRIRVRKTTNNNAKLSFLVCDFFLLVAPWQESRVCRRSS